MRQPVLPDPVCLSQPLSQVCGLLRRQNQIHANGLTLIHCHLRHRHLRGEKGNRKKEIGKEDEDPDDRMPTTAAMKYFAQ